MKKLHHWAAALLIVILITSSACTAQAASSKSKALAAYKAFLAKSTINWCETSYNVASSSCSFALAYVDNDNVPELLITSTAVPHIAGFYALYTYKGGKVKFVSNVLDAFSYYKRKGVFVSSYVGGGHLTKTYYTLKNGKATAKLKQDQNLLTSSWTYYKVSSSTDSSVTKTKFQSALKKLVGTKAVKEVTKLYGNTASNRKKHLK